MDLGLERITRLLASLTPPSSSSSSDKPPHLQIPIVHVAGTNGKGSICAYIASVLQASGYRVGRYNSPHLITPRDTIQINGQAISQADYDRATEVVRQADAAQKLEATSFELLTAAAFYWFAYGHRHLDEHDNSSAGPVDVAVIEVGVGGRLDATNIVPRPEVTVIASIGMDHAGLLGNTIEEVAFEKAGIIKAGVEAVVAPQREGATVYNVIEDRAVAVQASRIIRAKAAHWTPKDDSTSSITAVTGQWATLEDGFQVWIPLLGDFQLENVATAVVAIRVMQQSGRWNRITDLSIQQGIKSTDWPGRLQWIEPPTAPARVRGRMLIDGAHNPAAASALRAYVDEYLGSVVKQNKGKGDTTTPRTHWIMAFTRGKDIEEMFEILFSPPTTGRPECRDTFSAVEFSVPEGMPWVSPIGSEEVCARLEALQAKRGGGSKMVARGFGTDLDGALAWVGSQRGEADVVVLCGSLYLVADLFRLS
ncbi:hypothetical protein BGZ93_005966 [Podila epicladia]|nr:hypothetical protein BGZ92_008617 [Podila epicladia]KAG0095365.1 hypothetical protein BGZ93_005966 [Podila epicladia]